jgi:ABC-type dipeptide/oligopeptide/nickel transport system permease component
MRIFRFLFHEFILRGIVFAVLGTAVLSSLYFLSIGAPPESYVAGARSFLLMVSGSTEFSAEHPGFGADRIIASGAAVTLPLALTSLLILTLGSLALAAMSASARYLSAEHGKKGPERAMGGVNFLTSVMAAMPLFAGFWILGSNYGSDAPFLLIALLTVALGGLGWDASRFLIQDMGRQGESTHAMVFSSLGLPLGRFFPLPGTYSGYLLSSSIPRFIPYLAGKVPAIIGSVTIAEIVFSFPGLGSTLMEALLSRNTDLLVAAVFVLLSVNALVTFIVKAILFVLYPRWYEKAV